MPASKKRKLRNHTRTASAAGYGWGILSLKIRKSKQVAGRHQEVVSFNLALLIDGRTVNNTTGLAGMGCYLGE